MIHFYFENWFNYYKFAILIFRAMNNFNRFLIFISAVILFSACSVTDKINSSIYTTRQQPINRKALPYNPMIADLKVEADKKISGTAISQVDFATDAEVDNMKQLALHKLNSINKRNFVKNRFIVVKNSIYNFIWGIKSEFFSGSIVEFVFDLG